MTYFTSMINWKILKKSSLIFRLQILSLKNSAIRAFAAQPVLIILPFAAAGIYIFVLFQIPAKFADIADLTAFMWRAGNKEPLFRLSFIVSMLAFASSLFFFMLFVPEKRNPLWLHSAPLSNGLFTFGNLLFPICFFIFLIFPPVFIIFEILGIFGNPNNPLYLFGFIGFALTLPWIISGLTLARLLRFGLPQKKYGLIIFSFIVLIIALYASDLSPSAVIIHIINATTQTNFAFISAAALIWIIFGTLLIIPSSLIGKFYSPKKSKFRLIKKFPADNIFQIAFNRVLRNKEIIFTLAFLFLTIMAAIIFLKKFANGQKIPSSGNLFEMIIILGLSAVIMVPTIDSGLGWLWGSAPASREKQFKSYLAIVFGFFIFSAALASLPLFFHLASFNNFINSLPVFALCSSIALAAAIIGKAKLNTSLSLLALSVGYSVFAGSVLWLISFISNKLDNAIAAPIITLALSVIIFYISWMRLKIKQWENFYDF